MSGTILQPSLYALMTWTGTMFPLPYTLLNTCNVAWVYLAKGSFTFFITKGWHDESYFRWYCLSKMIYYIHCVVGGPVKFACAEFVRVQVDVCSFGRSCLQTWLDQRREVWHILNRLLVMGHGHAVCWPCGCKTCTLSYRGRWRVWYTSWQTSQFYIPGGHGFITSSPLVSKSSLSHTESDNAHAVLLRCGHLYN